MTYGVILFYYDGKLEQYIVLADSEKEVLDKLYNHFGGALNFISIIRDFQVNKNDKVKVILKIKKY